MRGSKRLSSAVWIALIVTLSCESCLILNAHAESAIRYYKEGRAAEDQNDILSSYKAYKKAYDLKPQELKFRAAYERIRVLAAAEYVRQGEKFAAEHNPAPALAAFLKAVDADPGNELADADARKIEDELQGKEREGNGAVGLSPTKANPAGPPRLEVSVNEPMNLYMSEDSRVVYQTVGKAAGINVLFDPEYNSKRIQIELKAVTPYEALDIISQISGTFWRPVSHNTIFVAQDTRTKRQTLSRQAMQIFYLKNVSQQNDLTDIQTALRNVLPDAKLYAVQSQNAIVMRATPDELQLAKIMIAGLDQAKPEVMVDITVMEVSHDKLREIGLSPPTSLTVSSGSSQTLNQIGSTSSYSVSMGQAAVQFLLTDSDTRILQNPRLRAVDGQKATLKLGEKLPIATGSYTVPTSSSSAAAETQFTYLDVGVNVDMTPTIHGNRDVTLKLSVEISAQSGTNTIDGVQEPVISQQKADQVIRLKDGETSILAGLVKRQVSQTVSGWPGLGEIPVMKYLFSTQSHDVTSDELVFLIVPHIVRASDADEEAGRPIDTGTGTAVQLRDASVTHGLPQDDRKQ